MFAGGRQGLWRHRREPLPPFWGPSGKPLAPAQVNGPVLPLAATFGRIVPLRCAILPPTMARPRLLLVALVPFTVMTACSGAGPVRAAPTTSAPGRDAPAFAEFVRSAGGDRAWAGSVTGASEDAGRWAVLTSLPPGSTATALLICEGASGWFRTAATPVAAITVVDREGRAIVTREGAGGTCSTGNDQD